MKGLLGQRLYLRIWLAIVVAVGLLALAVGGLWQVALDSQREQALGRHHAHQSGGQEAPGQEAAQRHRQ